MTHHEKIPPIGKKSPESSTRAKRERLRRTCGGATTIGSGKVRKFMTPAASKMDSGLPLRFFLDTKSTFGIPQVQPLEETGAKSSKGWKMVRLGEITSASTQKGDPLAQPNVPYIGLEHIERDLGIINGQGTAAEVRSTKSIFRTGDLLYGKLRPYLNKVWIAQFDGMCSTDILVYPQTAIVANAFLKYRFMTSDFVSYASENSNGVNLPRVNAKVLACFPISLPPIDEQRRIVAEIEKQFTRLEAGVSALKRVQANLKRYRAAVLKAACSGQLVPTEAALARARGQRTEISRHLTPEFETGAELLERILIERRKNWSGRGKYKEPAAPDTANLPPLPKGWTWGNVGQLGEIKGGKRLPMGHHYSPVPTAFPYIRVADFDNYGVWQDDLKFLHEETQKEIQRYTISKNDVYISIAGSIGVVGVVPDNLDGANLTENAAKITSLAFVEQKYICFWLSSNTGRSFIADKTIATTQPKLALFRIEVIPIPLPPLAEQKRIVEEVERRLSVVEELEAVVSANLQRATRLRQSILQKAFKGKLA